MPCGDQATVCTPQGMEQRNVAQGDLQLCPWPCSIPIIMSIALVGTGVPCLYGRDGAVG